ncbi:ethylene-insensitive protein 2-like isoform X2 [Tripterygium wilfordii]|uniref:ethylene-insensitive protein 2-like isoform X2 n=1 Tax=Tripterygium wilfordii TaxID=458696 RepID=UPI0018F80B88|nr:ethylene-insensitive protein 2-like isoform X2 [Tripterygium wilfordii]
MEAWMVNSKHQSGVLHRVLPAVVPVLLISIGYVDPGKWVAIIEGGAQYGFDLVALMLIFNIVSILCQCLSARIGIVTGRDLAQICSNEYDKWTCMFLGVQVGFSVIALDLTMMLGVAHGLNLIFGVDLSTCVFLTAIDAALFPLFASFLENRKANRLCVFIAGSIMLCYVIGVLISQPEFPLSMSGMLTKLSGESAFTVMSLLGASIMPHNFYLHSSLVQHRVPPDITKSAFCHDHFLAIICIFSGIYLVNYVLMNSAATVFNSTGLVLLTFPDALSLMEQVFRSPVAPLAFSLVLFCSNQITALTWNIGGQAVIHDFLRLEIPGWLHRATIRIIAAVPALYCVCTSGAEGVYQLLMFTQVMVALLLPSSVIPLFRIASSRPIMGIYKISQFVEFLILIVFVGILGLEIIFITEMIFGNSDWVSNLRCNMGNSSSVPYVSLLITACLSFGLMLWLAATPLKCASVQFDKSMWSWDVQKVVPEASIQREENDLSDTRYYGEEIVPEEQLPTPGRLVESQSDVPVENFDCDLPEKRNKFDQELHLTTIEENNSSFILPNPPVCGQGESLSTAEAEPVLVAASEVTVRDLSGPITTEIEITEPVEKTMGVEGDLRAEKDDDVVEGDSWEPEESSKEVPGSISSLASDGPSSFRSLSGKSDEGGNGAGSLSRLAGLGRAARRQLATILDEFWRQLYDSHGQVTQEAKAKKMDVMLGVDSKAAPASLKVESSGKEFSGYFPSLGGSGCDSLINPSLYDSPKQQRVQHGIDSSYGVQRGSSTLWSNHMQLLDASFQNSSPNVYDSSERRYSSLRSLPSSDGWDYQPATVHGYQIASHLNRLKEGTAECLHPQMESSVQSSPTLGPANYRDSLAFALGQKLQNGMSATPAPGFQSHAVSRISPLQSERPYYGVSSSGPADNTGTSANTKKYHSLPDISGLSVPYRDLPMSDKSVQWNNSLKYGTSVSRTSYDQSLYANAGSKAGAPLAFDVLSPSKAYRDPLSFQLSSSSSSGSLWSKQPFEQFGVADKNRATVSDGMGSRSNSVAQETSSVGRSEGKLLQSLRLCVVKLLKLEGSDWLFTQNDGADEDLIDRVAARERFLYEVENQVDHMGEPHYLPSDRMSGSALKNDEAGFLISSVPHCGEGCIWKPDLVISFGVWCIHRILDLSLMESRPELWGKYTYVLNRLQGIIDPAFSKPRSPVSPCFCLQIPASHQQRSSPPVANGMLPPAAKPGRGKCTTACMVLETVKDVEISISCRKGRSGTAAGDVAYPKGKENLASVLKRYKRRLANKPAVSHEGSGSRRVSTPGTTYGS